MEKMIYFIRYVNCKSIKILGLYFCRLIGKKKKLMVDGCMLRKVLDKVKEAISIEKVDDTKILIDTNDK